MLQVWQALSERTGRGAGSEGAALLFTDLVGFSDWVLDAGDEAALDLLRAVESAVEPAVRSGGGRIVKRLGDGHMAVFHDGGAAVRAALDIQDAIDEVEVAGHRPRLRAGSARRAPAAARRRLPRRGRQHRRAARRRGRRGRGAGLAGGARRVSTRPNLSSAGDAGSAPRAHRASSRSSPSCARNDAAARGARLPDDRRLGLRRRRRDPGRPQGVRRRRRPRNVGDHGDHGAEHGRRDARSSPSRRR